MTTNSVSRCQPQPCPLLTWYTKQILCHYLLLRNKTPRMILKNRARGRLKNGKCFWKSVCVAAGVHSPLMSPARLSCHLSARSYIVLSANLYNLNKRKEKVAAALNQYFRNQKQPWLCWANTNSFISFPMIRLSSSLSVAIYFWLLSALSGEALTECRIFCKCINKYLYLI